MDIGISPNVSLKRIRFLFTPRPGFPVKEEELPETVRLVHSPVFEISSTFIREALDAGERCSILCASKGLGDYKRKIIYVFEYIKIYIRQNITDNLSATPVAGNLTWKNECHVVLDFFQQKNADFSTVSFLLLSLQPE